MVRIKIISAGERDDPHASCDASRSPPDAPASPRAEPLDSPGAFPPLGSGSGPPSPATPPSPRRYPAPRAPRSSDDSSRGTSGGSSWSSGSGSDVPAAPPAVRAASECLALVRALAAELEAEKKKGDAAARAALVAGRDARRERARRESADARFDALSRLYVAKFKEATPRVIAPDARASSYPAPRAPGPDFSLPTRGETRGGGNDFSLKKGLPPVRVGATRTYASAAVFDDIDALFREARELVLGDDGENGGVRHQAVPGDEKRRSSRSETELCPGCPGDATRDATSLKKNVVFEDKNDADRAETKTTPKTPCVFTSAYARLGSRSDPANAGGPGDDSDLLPGWSFTGVVKDTKFRKRCPMHEGPCADCGARCRVPFRPTRGAARGRDDPLCARCLVARKEHRKAATERDWKERREETHA